MAWQDKKTGNWIASFHDGLGRRQVPYASQEEAEAAEHAGRLLRKAYEFNAATPTFEEAGGTFLAACEADGLYTHNIEIWLRCHLYPRVGSERIGLIDVVAAQKLQNELKRSFSQNYANKIFRTFKRVLKEAHSSGTLRHLIAESLPPETRTRSKQEPTPQKLLPSKDLLAHLLNSADGPLLVAIALAIYAGLRAGEIALVRWTDVRADGYLHIRRAKKSAAQVSPADKTSQPIAHPNARRSKAATKTDAGRRLVPICPELGEVLRRWRADPSTLKSPYVVVNADGGRYAERELERHFQRFQIGLGLWQWVYYARKTSSGRPHRRRFGLINGFHLLRHACVALWLEQRIPNEKLSKWIGHKNFKFTVSTYGYVFPPENWMIDRGNPDDLSMAGDREMSHRFAATFRRHPTETKVPAA